MSGKIYDFVFWVRLCSYYLQQPCLFQTHHSEVFTRLNFSHDLEHVITTKDIENEYGILLSSENIEFLSIDITDTGKRIGVEVDGPGHFVQVIDVGDSNDGEESGRAKKMGNRIGWEFTDYATREINGSTALKDRLLERLGWQMSHISFWEWRSQQGSGAKEDFCLAMIDNFNES